MTFTPWIYEYVDTLAAMAKWGGPIEVSPVVDHGDDLEVTQDPSEAHFWSVYLHHTYTTQAFAVANLPNEAEANILRSKLEYIQGESCTCPDDEHHEGVCFGPDCQCH